LSKANAQQNQFRVCFRFFLSLSHFSFSVPKKKKEKKFLYFDYNNELKKNKKIKKNVTVKK